jgi:hypothetical protein
MNIIPLRKSEPDGATYTRPENIELFIRATLDWPFEKLVERAKIINRQHPDYVPSEVLMYHLRSTRHDNSDTRFEPLYSIMVTRIEIACPRANSRVGNIETENLRAADLRNALVEHVVDLILRDRQEYCEQLDFFEIRFDRAIRLAKFDKYRRASRREDQKVPLEYDDETGDVVHEVEEALARLRAHAWSVEEDLTYQIQVRQAIKALPESERKVINMLLAEIPIESENSDEQSIVRLLGCTEKTVRNRRDRAILKLRIALGLEKHHE